MVYRSNHTQFIFIIFLFNLNPVRAKNIEKEIPQLKKLKPKVQLETVVNTVCEEFGCDKEQIITKGRKNNKVREVAIHIAGDLSGISCKDLRLYFGGVSGALITIMYKRVTKEAVKNRRLKHRIEKVKTQIFNI